MSQDTMDCPDTEATDHPQVGESARMRFDLIVRARRKIREGLLDDPDQIDQMLAKCMAGIADDARDR